MNTTRENTEKFIPRIIEFEGSFYIGFIDEKELEHPRYYRKFIGTRGYHLHEQEQHVDGDEIYEMSLGLYFQLSCGIREFASTENYRYNLNKFRHELNNRK